MWWLTIALLASDGSIELTFGSIERTLRSGAPFMLEADCLRTGKDQVTDLEKQTGRRFSYTCKER